MRRCNSCGETKELDLFVKHKSCKGGRTSKCKRCSNEWWKGYYKRNKGRIAETQKKSVSKRRAEGKDVNRPMREYSRRNPHYKKYYASKRRVSQGDATPSWLSEKNKQEILEVYKHASECEMLTGDKYHVDHIVPIRGENICGLHVPWNLQVLPADINLSKSNKF